MSPKLSVQLLLEVITPMGLMDNNLDMSRSVGQQGGNRVSSPSLLLRLELQHCSLSTDSDLRLSASVDIRPVELNGNIES